MSELMTDSDVQVGSTLMNDWAAIRVTEVGDDAWIGLYISLKYDGPDSATGTECQLDRSDWPYGWRHVPFEWTPVSGGALEERYVWSPSMLRLEHETRLA